MPGPEAVNAWLAATPGSSSTVTRRLAALKNWCRYAGIKPEWTEEIDRPRRRQGVPKPILDVAGMLNRLDPTSKLIALVLWQTAVRISEFCSIDEPLPIRDEIVVLGKGNKERVIPMTEVGKAALGALGGRSPWSKGNIERRFRDAGVPSPHKWRHTAACELIASGADIGDVQKLLGHSSPATTMVYAAYGLDRLRAAMERRKGIA